MKSREIILPFATIRNIKRPNIVNTIKEIHDFIVPMHNEERNRAYSLFFQINFDFKTASKTDYTKMIAITANAVEEYVKEYINDSNQKLFVHDPPHKFFDYSKIITPVFEYYFQGSSSIRTVKHEDGRVTPSFYMRLKRGITIYVSPEIQLVHQLRNLSAIGRVNLLGHDCQVYIRRPGLNLMKHVRYETIQETFSTTLEEEFPYLSSTIPPNLFRQAKIQFFDQPKMEGIVL